MQRLFPTTLLYLIITTLALSAPAQETSQAKSAIQFRDTTGTTKTAKIGWTGDATSGHFFVQTPNEGELIKSKAGGVEINGAVQATKFSGDGSELSNLPKPTMTVEDIAGLQDSLGKKADAGGVGDLQGMVSGKADTGWVKTKISEAGSSVTVPANSIDSGKIVDGGISGGDIDPETKLTVGDLTVNGNVGIGTSNPLSKLHLKIGDNQNFIISSANVITSSVTIRAINDNWSDNIPLELQASKFFFNGGNVGIGTSNPSAQLSIERTAPSDPERVFVRIKNKDISSTNGAWLNLFSGADPSSLQLVKLGSEYTGTPSMANFGAVECDGAGLHFSAYNPDGVVKFLTGGDFPANERVRIDKNGNVGIGTSVPGGKLDISGLHSESIFSSGFRFIPTSGYDGNRHLRFSQDNPNYDVFRLQIYSTNENGPRGSLALQPESGNVGIGTPSPAYTLDVNGIIRGTNVAPSDRRLKTSITPLTSSLEKVSSLQGVSYLWDRASFPHKNFPEGKQIGLIAQDVEEVIPEVVSTDAGGYKSLAYDRLVAVLIEAVKEQKSIVEKQQTEIDQLRGEIAEIKEKLGK